MKKFISSMIITFVLFISLSTNEEVQAKDDIQKMYEIFDKLYMRDFYESQGILVVDTINDGNEKIELDGVTIDKKVFYSSLYEANKNDALKSKIKEYKKTKTDKDYKNLDSLDYYIDIYNNSDSSFQNIVNYIDSKDLIKEYKEFFKELIQKEKYEDDRLINPLTGYEYEIVDVGYFEDYNENNTYYGLYYKKAEYYTISNVKVYTGVVKYDVAYGLLDYYPHLETTILIYNPDGSGNAPQVEYTLIIDYLGYQKMIITDTDESESPYKISQLTHYGRNDLYNRLYNDGPLVSESSIVDILGNSFTDGCNFFDWDCYNSYFHNLLLEENDNPRKKYKKNFQYQFLQTEELTYGSAEAIIYEDNNEDFVLDDSSLRVGTFNFGVSQSDSGSGESHRIRDVYPYLVWGNSVEDYLDHTPYERFIWDKSNLACNDYFINYNSNCTGINVEGNDLISLYEDGTIGDAGGDPIPSIIIHAENYLDYFAPILHLTTYSIYEDVYTDIDWATRVIAGDDYTIDTEIIISETGDDVNYNVPDTDYTAEVLLVDLAGNWRLLEISIIVKETVIPSC